MLFHSRVDGAFSIEKIPMPPPLRRSLLSNDYPSVMMIRQQVKRDPMGSLTPWWYYQLQVDDVKRTNLICQSPDL